MKRAHHLGRRGADECDAFCAGCRKLYRWRPGIRAWVRNQYNRRERRVLNRAAVAAVSVALLAGCTPALVRTCPTQAVRYSDETTVKLRDRGEMTYRVEWQCLPIERRQSNGNG